MADAALNANGCTGAQTAIMNADLGLFNQLLQMVDGDWSDSIRGICRHIHGNFDAMGVSLTVYDRHYREFIYLDYSVDQEVLHSLEGIGITMTHDLAADIIRKTYAAYPDILEEKIFLNGELRGLLMNYFGDDTRRVESVTGTIGLKAIASFPVIESNRRFRCIFHVFADREVDERDRALLEQYIPQLDVALEIVFLVRELFIKATHDGLTRLLNHKQGEMLLKAEMERVKRNRQPLTVVMMDLDHFKEVNDRFGHRAGDTVLEAMGSILTKGLRKCDIISRFGGEEFLLCLADTDLAGALEVTRRLKDTIQRNEFTQGDEKFGVTVSMGVVQFDAARHAGIDTIIGEADEKLYHAKNAGRNRIVY